MAYPIPVNETDRLSALRRYRILDTEPKRGFDDLAQLACHICQTPVALVTLIDEDRQWFKSRIGTSVCESSREHAFCAHAIMQRDVFIIPDLTKDLRFQNNPFVTHPPHVRFYAGAPFITDDYYALGTLCVLDVEPRTRTPDHISALQTLSRQVYSQLFKVHRKTVGEKRNGDAETGFGLAVVKRIAALHGGQVHAVSAGKPLGSTFTVRFDGVRFDGVRFDGVRFNAVRFDGVRFNAVRFETP